MPPDVRRVLEDTSGGMTELPDVPAIARRGRILVRRRRALRVAVAGAAVIAGAVLGSRLNMFAAAPLPPVQEAPELQSTPPLEASKPLEVGEYAADDFGIPFTLRIPTDGWFTGIVSPTWVYVTSKGVHVHVQRWDRGASSGGFRSLPEDLVAWLERHPGLNVQRTQPVDVGGVPATALDVRARHSSARQHRECPGTRCLVLARVAVHEEVVDVPAGDTARFYVVHTAESPIIIYWGVPTKRFDRLEPMLDRIVRSIRFL
ncbi:MAG: hypothetical protein M3N53_11750 [Actinomycetota bacterium]|nr:hypothetical protein [Actinomycetota bacterium]